MGRSRPPRRVSRKDVHEVTTEFTRPRRWWEKLWSGIKAGAAKWGAIRPPCPWGGRLGPPRYGESDQDQHCKRRAHPLSQPLASASLPVGTSDCRTAPRTSALGPYNVQSTIGMSATLPSRIFVIDAVCLHPRSNSDASGAGFTRGDKANLIALPQKDADGVGVMLIFRIPGKKNWVAHAGVLGTV